MVHITHIQMEPDPYEPFRLAQGYRVGDLLHLRADGHRRERAGGRKEVTSTPRPSRRSGTSSEFWRRADRASGTSSR
jgi:hypothetical protein